MKQLHRSDLFCWSQFDIERNIDFHSVAWIREQGNILIDPLPLSGHDANHLKNLGGVAIIVITNSDHIRDAEDIAIRFGAELAGPAAEQARFPLVCDIWLSDQQEIAPGLTVYELQGSKTPGELALVLEQTTLITGDLIRCHLAGILCLLPDQKLQDKTQAINSVSRLAAIGTIDTVLTGDGWPVFHNGHQAMQTLIQALDK
ncbi:MAG: MBL fold metallo-hydrolase [Gammaproteobacteria bacterium]|nr:MBL fold metallo-hydrolase [Gammaproteobacteria bacterium]